MSKRDVVWTNGNDTGIVLGCMGSRCYRTMWGWVLIVLSHRWMCHGCWWCSDTWRLSANSVVGHVGIAYSDGIRPHGVGNWVRMVLDTGRWILGIYKVVIVLGNKGWRWYWATWGWGGGSVRPHGIWDIIGPFEDEVGMVLKHIGMGCKCGNI